ncbi:MAG: carboxypeptidase regulatory-like domain-containing protein [Gammaproteobacteria bacterium]|nr:carboxypeptidase regulatory-like domain-containing protein [Gammaproteobacteria bacterium]
MSKLTRARGAKSRRVAGLCVGAAAAVGAMQAVAAPRPAEIPDGYISGVVESGQGPEAGVWVIAETTELKTPFVKIVVTDDEGRFVLPEMPEATYDVWVRGYGLADSAPVEGRPGDHELELDAVVAESPQQAAQVYPGNYWLSLLEPPAPDQFPGTGPRGNGISEQMQSQKQWLYNLKSACNFCHQLGNEITRTLDHMDHLGHESPEAAWIYRTQLGVRGGSMAGAFATFGAQNASRVFADWTNRVAAGEVPPAPPRPTGVERNVVVTLWDWGVEQSFMHDEIATDKNDPTVNAWGPIYAVSSGHGKLTVLDPVENDTYELVIPTREDPREVSSRFPPPGMPSNFWGNEHLWGPEHPSDPHNPMLDRKGRVWMTSKIRDEQPAWCGRGSDNKFAQYYPLSFSNRQASYYDPATGEFRLIDTCFATHHLQFDNDPDQTVYFNELLGPIVGWINTREYDKTGDEQAAQGWCPQVVDTNGDGRITKPWNAPDGEFDPSRDTEVRYNLYSVIPSPVDGSVWGASEQFPGYIVRVDRGDNPPETCITEVYKVPEEGFDPRGIDIDSNGVVWTALAGSSHLARFDRAQCDVLNGPETLDGTHCEAGWTLYETDGPNFAGTDVPADFHYYNWVDQHDVSGLGADTPFATGSNSDALLALDPESGDWLTFRVPYPLGFYHRGLDGRIDDPEAGWKGRALYANYGTHLVWHIEGGKGTKGKLARFQIRPDPLAH